MRQLQIQNSLYRQIMNERAAKPKKHSTAQIRPFPIDKYTATTAVKQIGCLPKNQPNIAQYSHYAHPRHNVQRLENGKENRCRDNDPHLLSTRDAPRPRNILLNPRKSHQPEEEDNLRRTQKRTRRMRQQRRRNEWVSVQEEGVLGCNQHLNSQIFRPGLSLSSQSHRKVGSLAFIQLGETGARQLSAEEQLTEFERRLPGLSWKEQSDSLNELVRREEDYSRSQYYTSYLSRQTNLTWMKRALVLDWVMLLAAELNCRREAFANSVNILDRFLAASSPLPQEKLQCLGAACLMIAEKLQDNARVRSSCFHEPISEQHSLQQLLNIEMEITITLHFKLRAPTVNAWANRLCAQWDLYVASKDLSGSFNFGNVRFKGADEQSYMNFRWMAQYIDFALLDIQTLQYKNRTLAAAFLYLTLLLRLDMHTADEVASTMRYRSQLVLEQSPFNVFYSNFLFDSFGFPLQDILPTVQYCSIFVVLPVSFELPVLMQEGEPMSFQEYCGLQTCNASNRNALQKLDRTFW